MCHPSSTPPLPGTVVCSLLTKGVSPIEYTTTPWYCGVFSTHQGCVTHRVHHHSLVLWCVLYSPRVCHPLSTPPLPGTVVCSLLTKGVSPIEYTTTPWYCGVFSTHQGCVTHRVHHYSLVLWCVLYSPRVCHPSSTPLLPGTVVCSLLTKGVSPIEYTTTPWYCGVFSTHQGCVTHRVHHYSLVLWCVLYSPRVCHPLSTPPLPGTVVCSLLTKGVSPIEYTTTPWYCGVFSTHQGCVTHRVHHHSLVLWCVLYSPRVCHPSSTPLLPGTVVCSLLTKGVSPIEYTTTPWYCGVFSTHQGCVTHRVHHHSLVLWCVLYSPRVCHPSSTPPLPGTVVCSLLTKGVSPIEYTTTPWYCGVFSTHQGCVTHRVHHYSLVL